MAGLLEWLAEQRLSAASRDDEHLVRMESDEKAVKIVTVHKSKGLEYPIVFCPYLWDRDDAVETKKRAVLFHDIEDDHRLKMDCGSPDLDAHGKIARKEQMAENLRLAYVALTRAKNRCYTSWGRFHGCKPSAPAYLFHSQDMEETEQPGQNVQSRLKGMSSKDMLNELKAIADASDDTIGVYLLEDPESESSKKTISKPSEHKEIEPLYYKEFTGHIRDESRISSFSSLTTGIDPHGDIPVEDQPETISANHPEQPDAANFNPQDIEEMLAFPRGSMAGTFWHSVFEDIDFTAAADTAKSIIPEKLDAYGMGQEFLETVSKAVSHILSIPLETDQPDFTLDCIANADRITEMAFYFPLKNVSEDQFKRVFQSKTGITLPGLLPESIDRLNFSIPKGFMRGFIDLVFRFEDRFYILDWKSNFLGEDMTNYHQDALPAAMRSHQYFLQYYIYTVALDRYLKLRMPKYDYDTHFGGVYYLFIRGMHPAYGSAYGIFRDIPPAETIDRLADMLIGDYSL